MKIPLALLILASSLSANIPESITGDRFPMRTMIGGDLRQYDESLLDDRFPEMKHWAKAGVQNGIGERPPIVEVLDDGAPQETIQAAIDRVSKNGGGTVLLKKGVYRLTKTLNMRSGVVLSGEFFDQVKVEVDIVPDPEQERFPPAVHFHEVDNAGLQHLKLVYISAGDLRPTNRRRLEPSFEFTPEQFHHLRTPLVGFSESRNCYIQACGLTDAGDHPLFVWKSEHITVRYCEITGAYNRQGGDGYVILSTSQYILLAGLIIEDVRHLGLIGREGGGPDYIVIIDCDLEVDVNFHGGDRGGNLVEGNELRIPSWHWWPPIERGIASRHEPPGPRNFVFKNDAQRYRFGTYPRDNPTPDPATVYIVEDSHKGPRVRPFGPAPKGGTLYPMVRKAD